MQDGDTCYDRCFIDGGADKNTGGLAGGNRPKDAKIFTSSGQIIRNECMRGITQVNNC